ncbi:MAG: hypothetical protein R3186_10670, partial [Ruegeria sp.]|nr:hypothetical protein [Ruegeria sp.]
ASVVERARVVLNQLEKTEREGGKQKALIDDLPLFSAAPPPPPPPVPKASPVTDMLKDVLPDELTPREALDLIYKLKEAARS